MQETKHNSTGKMESFWPKKLVGDAKIRPGIPSNLRILGITGRILVPSVTQHFRSKWHNFFFQWEEIG